MIDVTGVGVTHLEKGCKYDYVTSCRSNFIDKPLSHLENFSIAQKKILDCMYVAFSGTLFISSFVLQ